MGRLIDADEVNEAIYKNFEDIQFYDGTGYDIYSDSKEIIDKIETVEAIPKAEYETRLKADMVAMLTEIQLEIEEEKQDTKHLHYDDLENAESYNNGIDNCIDTIQQRINELKEEVNEEDVNR